MPLFPSQAHLTTHDQHFLPPISPGASSLMTHSVPLQRTTSSPLSTEPPSNLSELRKAFFHLSCVLPFFLKGRRGFRKYSYFLHPTYVALHSTHCSLVSHSPSVEQILPKSTVALLTLFLGHSLSHQAP